MAEAVAVGEQYPWPEDAYRDIRYRGKSVENDPSTDDDRMHLAALYCELGQREL